MAGLRPREAVGFTPSWEAVLPWTKNFIRDNKWRCDAAEDQDDLLQDAWLVFDRVATSYPRVVDPAHFFVLYERSLTNKFHDKSCRKTRRGKYHADLPSDVNDFFIEKAGEVTNGGYVNALIAEAPEEVKLALLHLTKPEDRPKKRARMSIRENLSSRLRRTYGLAPDVDAVSNLKRHFAV